MIPHRENLLKLAMYLLSLPEDYEQFDMAVIYYHPFINTYTDYENSKLPCNTVACAIGHSFAARVIPPEENLPWASVGYKFYGMVSKSQEWTWCFSCRWREVDNTAHGAGKRILFFLENGLPENWYEQLSGKNKLCYI